MYRAAVIPLLLGLALAVPAAEKTAPQNALKAVAPFLDEQTIAVARLDLRRIDAEALIQRIGQLSRLGEGELAEHRKEANRLFKSLTDAGAREVYIVLSLTDLPFRTPFVVVPTSDGGRPPAVEEALRGLRLDEVARIGPAVVAGTKATLKRLREQQPAEVPDLAKAFAAAGDSAIQVAAVMPETLRRSLEEAMPKLPAEVGDGSIRVVTRGLRWAGLGVDLTPKLALRLTVQAGSADEAKALDGLVAKVFEALPGKAEKLPPQLARVLQMLRPRLNGDRLTLTLGDKELSEGLAPLVGKVQDTKLRIQSTNNLKQLALAMHNYHDVHKSLPAHASHDKFGRPLLSWRVLLLPYLDEEKLYKEFHLDEPWDSDHNKKLIARMPAVFRDPLAKAGPTRTTYLVPVGKDTIFPRGRNGLRIQDITDGTSNTIFIVESDDEHAAVWTRPEDLKVDLERPLRGLAGEGRGWFLAAFADGSIHVLQRSIAPATLRALFTRNGGEAVDLP